MMTEEETGAENNYIRHRQSWRSSKFNLLVDKLDNCKNPQSLAKQRELGDVIVRTPPPNEKWMISNDNEDEQECEQSDSSASDHEALVTEHWNSAVLKY